MCFNMSPCFENDIIDHFTKDNDGIIKKNF